MFPPIPPLYCRLLELQSQDLVSGALDAAENAQATLPPDMKVLVQHIPELAAAVTFVDKDRPSVQTQRSDSAPEPTPAALGRGRRGRQSTEQGREEGDGAGEAVADEPPSSTRASRQASTVLGSAAAGLASSSSAGGSRTATSGGSRAASAAAAAAASRPPPSRVALMAAGGFNIHKECLALWKTLSKAKTFFVFKEPVKASNAPSASHNHCAAVACRLS